MGKITRAELHPVSLRHDLNTLHKNIYADLTAQDDAHREEIANLTTAVNDLGNSLMELSDASRTRTVNLVRSMDSTDQRVRDCENRLDSYSAENLEDDARLTDLNDRLRRAERRLDNAATFGNGSIQDAFRLIRELTARLDSREGTQPFPDGCEYPDCSPPQESPSRDAVLADGSAPAGREGELLGAAEGAIAHVPAPVTGTPVAASEAAPEVVETTFAEWREQTHSDAAFLRFIATEKYSFPLMVKEGLLRVAERLENAADRSDGSWV